LFIAASICVFITNISAYAGNAVRKFETSSQIGIANQDMQWIFSKLSGQLVSLKNLRTGDEYIKGQYAGGNCFRAYVDATKVPPTLEIPYPYPAQGPEDALGGTLVDPKDCRLKKYSFEEKSGTRKLILFLYSQKSELEFCLEIVPADSECFSTIDLQVSNQGKSSRSVMVAVPYFTGLQLGDNADTNLAVHLAEVGQSRAKAWANHGDIYGRNWNGQWNAVYELSRNEGLGLIVPDKTLQNKIFRRFAGGGMSVFYFDKQTLEPGQSIIFPQAEVLVNIGDWKVTARRYRQWFSNAFKLRQPPQWWTELGLRGGGWVPQLSTVEENRKKNDRCFKSFKDLDLLYVGNQEGFCDNTYSAHFADFKEWAMYWECIDRNHWWCAVSHTDGDYTPRSSLGGYPELKEGVVRVEHVGRYVGLYIASKMMRKDSPMLQGKDYHDWLLMDSPGKAFHDHEDWFWVCNGLPEWQDHIAKTCKELLAKTGASYIRLDEYSHTFAPCFNPKHHHKSPYDAMKWDLEFLRKVRQAMDEVNPDAVLLTENVSEIANLYVNGGLMFWTPGPEIAPLRLADPTISVVGCHSGVVEAALQGIPCGTIYACNSDSSFRGNWQEWTGLEAKPAWYPARTSEEKEGPYGTPMRWHELSVAFAEAFRECDPSDVNPTVAVANPDSWAGRMWRSKNYWLMVCGNRAAIRPAAPVRVKIFELPAEITKGYEFDVETLAMREVPVERIGKGIFVSLTSGFSAVLFPKHECPALILMDVPEKLQLGTTWQGEIKAYAPWNPDIKPRNVTVAAPGVAEPVQVNLPGRVTLSIPDKLFPGSYYVKVNGKCLVLKRWFMIAKP
jgi:hypothetical protein